MNHGWTKIMLTLKQLNKCLKKFVSWAIKCDRVFYSHLLMNFKICLTFPIIQVEFAHMLSTPVKMTKAKILRFVDSTCVASVTMAITASITIQIYPIYGNLLHRVMTSGKVFQMKRTQSSRIVTVMSKMKALVV